MANLFFMILFLAFVNVYASFGDEKAGFTCTTMNSQLHDCIPFIEGAGNIPQPACCAGARQLASTVGGKADVVMACECIKEDIPVLAHYVPTRVAELPNACSVNINFPAIVQTTDCNDIQYPSGPLD